jgi:hypothetical protein
MVPHRCPPVKRIAKLSGYIRPEMYVMIFCKTGMLVSGRKIKLKLLPVMK